MQDLKIYIKDNKCQQDLNNLWSRPRDPNKPFTFATSSPQKDPILHSDVHISTET